VTHRIRKLLRLLEQEKIDALLITKDVNISYLTSFVSRESWTLISPKQNFFITDFRYYNEAKEKLKEFSIVKINGSIFDCVAKLAKKIGIKRLGFESKNLSFAEYKKINKEIISAIKFIPTFDLIESLRQIKTEDEIAKIRQAIKINIQGFKYLEEVIKPGISERDIAIEFENFIKKNGADLAFETIVAAGSNSAYPHAQVSRRKLKKNESVLIDSGVVFQGYRSDLTRIFFLGRIPLYFSRLYQQVQAAQEIAIKKIAAGVRICDIDKCARNFLSSKKLGRFFGHSLGHGIGMETHENPSISSKNKTRLSSGMIFTVEPAIYLHGKFGIRIEDIVLVRDSDCEVLSGNLDKSIKSRINSSY
jgi:Xaa-Pro aminopeptidase